LPSESSSARQRAAWQAIADNIALASAFMGDMNDDDLDADIKTVYSVVRCLEIIS